MSSNVPPGHLETAIFGLIHNLLDTRTHPGMPGYKSRMSAALEALEMILEPFGKGEEAIVACVEFVFSGKVEIIPGMNFDQEEVPVLLSTEMPRKFEPVFLRDVVIEYLRKHSDWGSRLALEDLPNGETGYASPWALWKHEDGKPRLQPGFTLRCSPDPVFCMRVEKREDGYHVEVPEEFSWVWRQYYGIPEPKWLPLAEVVTPEPVA